MTPVIVKSTMLIMASVICAATNKSEHYGTLLHKYLFQDYHTEVRPVLDDTKPVDVTVKLSLIRIHQVDEISQSLKTTVNLYLYWIDELLTWNGVEFGGLSNTVFPYRENIWIPDLMLSNALDKPGELGMKGSFVALQSNGQILMWTQVNFETSCEIKTKKYPFDEQMCQIIFTKFMTTDEMVAIIPMEVAINLDDYVKTAEWNIIGNHVTTSIDEITDPNFVGQVFNYTMIYYNLTLQRNCHSCIINIILPVLVLAFLNLLTFFVPCGSGEKTSFPISIFLTLAVFLTVITHSLPESVDGVSYLSSFVTFQLVVSAITLLSAVISLQIFHRTDNRPVPRTGLLLIRVLKGKRHHYVLGHLKGRQCEGNNIATDLKDDINTENSRIVPDRQQSSNSLRGRGAGGVKQWRDFSDAFDRLMFILLLLGEAVTTAAFLVLIMG